MLINRLKFLVKEIKSDFDKNVFKMDCFVYDGENLVAYVITKYVGGQLEPQSVFVKDDYQRNGIATKMYEILEIAWGRPILPSQSQTTEGQLFWKSRSR